MLEEIGAFLMIAGLVCAAAAVLTFPILLIADRIDTRRAAAADALYYGEDEASATDATTPETP